VPKRPSYRFGGKWIAENDEPEERDVSQVEQQVSVLLLADLFDKPPVDVAIAICRLRNEWLEVPRA
jgi:hypothetical protein